MGENFAYCFAFGHYMLVKVGHNVGTAIDGGRGLVFFNVRYSVTAKPTHRVLIDYTGFCIRIGLGDEKGFKVGNEVKFQRVFFVVVFKF